MKITVINKGSDPVTVAGADVAAGSSVVLTGLDKATAALAQKKASRTLLVLCEPDAADLGIATVDMATTADPAIDGVNKTGVGFTLKDSGGSTIAESVQLGLAVFDDATCLVPSATATLSTPTTGTIDLGSGTNRAEVTADGGVVALRVNIPLAANKTVYVKAFAIAATKYVLDTTEIDTIVFTKT